MPKLTESLVLSRSRATSLDAVKKLNCWASKIDDISVVKNLENVEIVNLSCNALRSLEPFRHCEQLRELYVRRNSIQALAEIQHLKDLDYLKNLWLADNPCTECDHYRMTVIKTLPSLEKLDNQAITEEERESASEKGLNLGSPVRVSTPDPEPEEVNGSPHGQGDPMLLSLEETNRLRVDLGLKPVSVEKHAPSKSSWSETKPQSTTSTPSTSSNTVQAILLLLENLDVQDLEQVQQAVTDRLQQSETETETETEAGETETETESGETENEPDGETAEC